jgi:anti-sigma regulatory factor (Ser/Thr protein kinase)
MSMLELELPPETTSPGVVRRALAARFGDHPDRDDLLLCASEVVTNAVLHANTPFQVVVTLRAGRLRVSVRDGSEAAPVRKNFAADAPTGRGLHLLDALSTAWGVDTEGPGKAVWFEFPAHGR